MAAKFRIEANLPIFKFIHNLFSDAEHRKFVFTYKYLFKLKAL